MTQQDQFQGDPQDPAQAQPQQPATEPERIPVEELPHAGPEKRSRAVPWVVGGSLVGVLALAYGGLAWWTGERVPEGTTVAGIDVGGTDKVEARRILDEQLPAVLAAPVPVHLGEVTAELSPQDAGLGVDVHATVDRLTGFTLDPTVIYERLTGGEEREPVVTTDGDTGGVDALARSFDTQPVDGIIDLVEGRAEVTDPIIGHTLDTAGAAQAMADAWPTDQPVDLPVTDTEPEVNQQVIDTAMSEEVDPLLSAPVTLSSDEHIVELTPQDLTEVSTMENQDGALHLVVDGESLLEIIKERDPELGLAARDASFTFETGAPTIVPSETGMGVEPGELSEAVRAAALTEGERTASVDLKVTEPEFTTADAEALGVKEVVSEFATNITSDWGRTQNLILGSQRITGVLVKPGERFSLLEHLSPITAGNGYHAAGVVSGGFTDEAVGGGLSQLSTNTYNAGFLAGMVDIEHKPHSRYYSRYPAGREATLWEGQIDMIWKNDTPYGVVVQAWVSGGQQHVRLWSTKYWEVNTWTSGRYAITKPEKRVNNAASCVPEGPGPDGFTIDIFRDRLRDGVKVDSQSWHWTYNPWHAVECG